jgi:hypothetical protein
MGKHRQRGNSGSLPRRLRTLAGELVAKVVTSGEKTNGLIYVISAT